LLKKETIFQKKKKTQRNYSIKKETPTTLLANMAGANSRKG